MLPTRQFCQEANIDENHHLLSSFWKTRQEGQFIGQDGLRLHWCAFTKKAHTKAIIVVNGRTESIVKYKEIFFDLFSKGYDIYSYDHRGQGLSQRLVVGKDVGHVVKFEHYVDDLETFINLIPCQKNHQKRTLLAHSMGGAIAALYSARKPSTIDKLALCAPMLSIYIPKWLRFIAKPLARACLAFEQPANYALGQAPYQENATEMKFLTHSTIRYQDYRKLFLENPHIQVGGPSSCWVYQSLQIEQELLESAAKISFPILLLQGGKDTIVSNEAMFKFNRARQQADLPIQFEIQANGLHELLFEQDNIRDTVLNLILDFAEC